MTSADTLADVEPLSDALRRRTTDAHTAAERSPLLGAVVTGTASRAAVATMYARLAEVYAALEETGDALSDSPVAGPFVRADLTRGDRFADDVHHLAGVPIASLPSSPAALAYAERVREASAASAVGFVAHHYTRFMGDLSGGQFLRAGVVRAFGLTDDRGVRSLTFEGIDPPSFRADYRARLDALVLDADDRERLIAEVLVAYELNDGLLADIDPGLDAAGG